MKFLGSIISGIISRIVIMALMFGGSAYFVKSQGGIGGVMALVTGEQSPGGAGGGITMPSVAGLSGLSALLPGAEPQKPAFFAQQARISEIKVVCRLSVQQGGSLSQTQPLDCARARAALHDPKFAGYKMQKNLTATYIYYAMDGVNVHTGSMALTGRDKLKRVGDVLNIRVNSKDPAQSTPI